MIRTQWQGSSDHLTACDESEAASFYEECQRQGNIRVEFDAAFPDIKIEEA
jgi:hypothetical protein